MEAKAKPKKKPRCRRCGKVARYYGPVGGYSVQCKDCNAEQSAKRRTAAARLRELKRKPRRVVLGVGHPWFYAPTLVGGRDQRIAMFLTPAHQVFTGLEPIDSKDLGNWNKIRLIAEVLK